MLKRLQQLVFGKTAADFPPITERVVRLASDTTVVVKIKDKGQDTSGRGQGVLIAPDVILTAAHVFRDADGPRNIDIIRPMTKEVGKIERIASFNHSEVCFVFLRHDMTPPYAAVETMGSCEKNMPVVLPYFFSRSMSKGAAAEKFKRGKFESLHDTGTVTKVRDLCMLGEKRDVFLATVFNLQSVPGESGGPLINGAGKVVSVLSGGTDVEASGPTLAEIHDRMVQAGLSSLRP